MNFTNFRLEVDGDGIALATWDMPGRSMNVITPQVMEELARIADHVASDEAIKGCVVTSGKEAFSAVVLRYIQALEIDPARVNVNGGAIAMGHPLGATGAMILGTVLDELERRDLNTALVTLCIGAGMGTATIIERV